MYQISFYVPEADAEKVKAAMFAAGGGELGDYRQCAWQTLGQGQFLPEGDAKPAIGSVGEVTRLPELKVEMVSADDRVKAVVSALIDAHPYEEPAYGVVKILTLEDL